MSEKRQHERIEAPLEIRITWPDHETKVSHTINFSDGGALMNNPFSNIPQKGIRMSLQLTSLVLGKEAPVLWTEVVRADASEIAFKFVKIK